MLRLLAIAILAVTATAAPAQVYPSRPLTMVVPYPAGGVTDALGRLLAERMKISLGQTIVTENVGGAGGSIGAGRVARGAPDGYTFLLGNAETNVFAGAALSLPYDVRGDFEPIVLLPRYPFLIVTHNSVPAKDLGELVAWIRSHPEKVAQGTVGAGTVQHLCGVYLQNTIGVRWQLVPYRGGTPAMQDLLSGQVNLMCTASGSFLPLVRSGQIRAYAVTAPFRIEMAPEIPTVDEAGLPGIHASVWNAFFAPKGTPQEVIARLNAAAVAALADPELHRRVLEMGLEMPPPGQRTPEALDAFQRAEIARWWPIVKAANAQ
jgi:tripartite-type tricarboxylate transporter receptor subunit TctC